MKFLTIPEFLKDPAVMINKTFRHEINKRGFYIRNKSVLERFSSLEVHIYVENSNSIYYHVIVPSELRANDYDIVINLVAIEPDSDVDDWVVRKVFSNNPAFIFEFGYVYFHSGILVEFLSNKYSQEILGKSPEQKNPKNIIGFDHSVYHALTYLWKNKDKYFDRNFINDNSLVFDKKYISERIKDQETVIREFNKGKLKSRTFSFTRVRKDTKSVYDKAKEQLSKFSRTVSKIGDSITEAKPKIVAKKGSSHRIQKIKPKKKI